MVRKTFRRAALALALAISGPALAQLRPEVTRLDAQPKSFLFVGNSFYYYNNSMHSYFLDLARKADPVNAKEYRGVSATISGSGLNWHDMEGYFGKGMASYSFDENNNVVFNSFEKPFDELTAAEQEACGEFLRAAQAVFAEEKQRKKK